MAEPTEVALRRFQELLKRSLVEDRGIDLRMAVELRTGGGPPEGGPSSPADWRPTSGELLAEHARFTRLPLIHSGADRQEVYDDGGFKGTLSGVLFFTENGARAALDFIRRAEALEALARRHYGATGAGVEPWAGDAAGWYLLVCRLALIHGDLCPYQVVSRFTTDARFPEHYQEADRFRKSWDLGDWPPPGTYVIAPNDDARSASIEAIELLLKIGPGEAPGIGAGAEQPQTSPTPQEQWVKGSWNSICVRLGLAKSNHAGLRELERIGAIEIKPIPSGRIHQQIKVRIIDRTLLDVQPKNWPQPA